MTKTMSLATLTTIIAVAVTAAGCGGNYSNEDVDFQLALPEESDLTVKLPGQALLISEAAEYYRATREVVVRVNLFVVSVVRLVDRVRAFPPSERRGDARVWGPFPNERDPAFELRMTVTRNGASPRGLQFAYDMEFQRVGAAAGSWQPLLSGTFIPAGGARLGRGTISLDLVSARREGYPVAEFNELQDLKIAYQRTSAPYTVEMKVRNVPEAPTPGADYAYAENADGSGQMSFVWQVRDNLWVQAAELVSRWVPGGAGRADARIIEGLAAAAGALGVDCWGPDTRATYVRRDFGERRNEGDPASCVLGAPAP